MNVSKSLDRCLLSQTYQVVAVINLRGQLVTHLISGAFRYQSRM